MLEDELLLNPFFNEAPGNYLIDLYEELFLMNLCSLIPIASDEFEVLSLSIKFLPDL